MFIAQLLSEMVYRLNTGSKRGFTLIELMVVVVIVGVLAAIAIPKFSEAARKSKYSQARLHLKRMYQALDNFYAERGCYPKDVWPNINPPGLVPNYLDEWPGPDRDPLNAVYDYEQWPIGGGVSWIGVVYVGPDLLHDGGTNAGSYYTRHGGRGDLLDFGNDVYIVVDLAGKPCP